MLATESFGEGIFIDLSKSKVDDWFEKYFNEIETFNKNINRLWNRFLQSEFLSNDKFSDKKHLAKFILLHTFSHILIKEMEFLCGYSATSMNERLSVDSENMQGVLIYTVAGSEGSYGGLINQIQSHSKKFYNRLCFVLKIALQILFVITQMVKELED